MNQYIFGPTAAKFIFNILLIFNLFIFNFEKCFSYSTNPISFTICNSETGESLFTFFAIEQDDCLNAINLPNAIIDSGTNVGSTQSAGENIPSVLVAPISSVWYTYNMTFGFNRVNVTISSGTIQNPVVSFYRNGCPGILVKQLDFTGMSFPATLQACLPIDVYTVQVATNAGDEGTYNLEIEKILQGVPNDGCDSTNLPIYSLGYNPADNSCSLDGYVWYKYVHQGGPNADGVHVLSTNSNFVINAILLNDCQTQVPDVMCLKQGDVLLIEAGSMANTGTFNIRIIPYDNPVVNDDCDDVPDRTLSCTSSLSGFGNMDACPDKVVTCSGLTDNAIVWDKIVVDANLNNFEITGNNFEVFTGSCNNLQSFACSGDPVLLEMSVEDFGNEFYIATGENGIWSASASPGQPTNIECVPTHIPFFMQGVPLIPEERVYSSTSCAPPSDMAFCNLNTTTDHYVFFYVYTPNHYIDIEIEIQAFGNHPASDLNFAIFDKCDGRELVSGCNGETTLKLECVPPKSILPVVVGSSEGSFTPNPSGAGDFAIMSHWIERNGPENDVCSEAEVIPYNPQTDLCKWKTVSGDLTKACPENFLAASCFFDVEPTIWYSLTVTNQMTGIEFNNLTPGTSLGIFEEGCIDNLNDTPPKQIGSCISDEAFVPLDPGTYFISVSGMEGPFSFDFLVNNPPPNDLCANVHSFNLNTVTPGYNYCATPVSDAFPKCAEGDQYGVWYSYTVAKAVKTLTLEVNNFSSEGILNVAAFQDCSGIYYNNDSGYEECGETVKMDIDCPVKGSTIYFMVSSTLEDEGDFDLIITETEQVSLPNDICDLAIEWEPPRCEAVKFGPYSNVTACPEPFDSGDCDLNKEETVWFKIKLPNDAKTMDIGINEYTGSGRATFVLFENCDGFGLDNECHSEISSGYPEQDGAHINVEAYKGKTIFLAYSSQFDDGGEITFDVKVNTPPSNDEICHAQAIIDTLTSGTTFCAYNDIPNFPCAIRDDNQVWYSYKVKPGENGFSVKLQNTGLGGPFGAALMIIDTTCLKKPVLLDSTSFYCNIGTKALVANCLQPGDSVLILVSTATVGMGEFNIELIPSTENTTCYDNATCPTALNLGMITTDADCISKLDCNINSCPINYDLCSGSNELHNVVWYQLQNDGKGEYLSVDVNSSSFEKPVVILYKGDNCDDLTLINPCIIGSDSTASTGPIQIDISGATPLAGENYFIAVGSLDLVGGDFTICVELISGCVNDQSCDAVNLIPNAAPISNPASTINCTGDLVNDSCPSSTENTVWYKFTVPKGTSSASVIVSNNTIIGSTSVQIGEWTLINCDTPALPFLSECFSSSNFEVHLTCLKEDQTYYIQIGSESNMNAGDFSIQIMTSPSLSQNDLCSQAIPLLLGNEAYCEFITTQGTTLNACPDDFSSGSCHFDVNNTVWYSISIPNDPNIKGMDIEVKAQSIADPYFAILEDDCKTLNPILSNTDCILANNGIASIHNVNIDAGANYLIPISALNGSVGSFEVRVKLLSPPNNDRCNGAYDLTLDSELIGNNFCATNDGVYDFTDCPQILNEADVWYILPIDQSLYDAYTISLSNWTGSGNYGIEVFGSTIACNAIPLDASSCNTNGSTVLNVPVSCLDDAIQFLYIKIGSQESHTGEFQIKAEGIEKLQAIIHPIKLCENSQTINLNDSIVFNQMGITGTWSSTAIGGLVGNFFKPSNVIPGVYDIIFTVDENPGGDCEKNIIGQIEITSLPYVEKLKDGSPCNKVSSSGPTVLNLFDLLKPGYAPGMWSQISGSPLSILANGEVDFDGIDPYTEFVFSYTTTNATIPCENISVSVNVVVDNCDCPNVITFPPQDICNSASTFDLKSLQNPNIAAGIWTVKQDNNSINVANNQFMNVTGLSGDFTLTYTLNPLPDIASCPKESVQTLHIEDQKTAQLISSSVQVCNIDRGNQENVLDLTSLLELGSANGQWINTDNAPIDFSDPSNLVFGNTVNEGNKFTFTYVVQNNAPCDDTYQEVEVEIKPCLCLPLSPLNPGSHCNTEGVINLSLYDDALRTGGSWTSPQLTIINNQLDLSIVNAGNYDLIYTPLDLEPNCEPAKRTITIINQHQSGTSLGTIQRCYHTNEKINLFDLLTREDLGGNWKETTAIPSTGNAFNAANGTFDISNVSVNTYSFEYFFENELPCTKTASTVFVKINNTPVADAGNEDTLTCTQNTAVLGLISSSGPNITYAWSHDGGKLVPDANKANTTVNFPGTFTLTVTDNDTKCSATDQVTINVSPDRPTANVQSKNITCFGDKDGFIHFTDIASINPPLKFSIDNGITFRDGIEFNRLNPGIYNVVLKDANGCLFQETVTLTEPPLLSIDPGENMLVLRGAYIEINLENQIDTNRINHIIWTLTDENGESVVCEKPDENCLVYGFEVSVNSLLCVEISDEEGCTEKACVKIDVIKSKNIKTPNVIDPNSSDNNMFFIGSDDIATINELNIFDRWGNLLFTAQNILPNDPQSGWNGTFNGKSVSDGVYVYRVDVTYKDGNERTTLTGDVTVLK